LHCQSSGYTTTMKKTIFFYLIILLSACNIPNKENKRTSSELYNEAKELKGLGPLILEKTTIKDLYKIEKSIQKDSRYEEFEKHLFEDDKINGSSCPLEKNYKIYKLMIGDIEVGDLHLKFYNDTLFKIECDRPSSDLINGFLQKYGKGTREKYNKVSGLKGHKNIDSKDQIIWENEKIKAIRENIFLMKNEKIKESYDYMVISLKSGRIQKAIRQCCDSINIINEKEKNAKKQDDLKLL
jgi:hypothetical protein